MELIQSPGDPFEDKLLEKDLQRNTFLGLNFEV